MQDLSSTFFPNQVSQEKTLNGPNFHTAITIEHKILAGKFHHFVFETQSPFVFTPGQYINVKVSDERINDYSIAGCNSQNKFDLLVDISPGGPGSKFFENLKVGDKITYLGPSGTFTFKPDDGSNRLLFLATGSGCSPLKCIIESALKENSCQKPVSLYFGLRYNSDIFWQDYFQNLSREHPNFNFKLVLSKPDQNWQGLSGHITELVSNDFPDASGCSTYLCGNKAMIDEATNILLSKGCPKERIYSEKF